MREVGGRGGRAGDGSGVNEFIHTRRCNQRSVGGIQFCRPCPQTGRMERLMPVTEGIRRV